MHCCHALTLALAKLSCVKCCWHVPFVSHETFCFYQTVSIFIYSAYKLQVCSLNFCVLCSDLLYDIVLMHSDDSEKFAAYLYDCLTASNPYRTLVLPVFQYPDDVVPGYGQYNNVDYITIQGGSKKLRQIFLAITLVNMDQF